MSQNKLDETNNEVNKLLEKLGRDLLIVGLKGMGLTALATFGIVAVAVTLGLLETSFTFISGFATVVLIQLAYIRPSALKLSEKANDELLKIINKEP